MSSVTSVEMNYLIFRYLQESGFTHAAFTFGFEAGISKCSLDGSMVPPGALITFVQRGLQYLEMDANLTSGETAVDEEFLFLRPIDIITKNVQELRQIIKEKKKNLQEEEQEKDKEKVKDDRERVKEKSRHKKEEIAGEGKRKRERNGIEQELDAERGSDRKYKIRLRKRVSEEGIQNWCQD